MKSIPGSLKDGISVGIGIFICLLGLKEGGIVIVKNNMLVLGNVWSPEFLIVMFGVCLLIAIYNRKITGSFLITIFILTILAFLFKITNIPNNFKFFSLLPSLKPIAFKFSLQDVFSIDMITAVLVLLLVEMFNTLGTLVVCLKSLNLNNGAGDKNTAINKALLVDAVGTTLGACMGTSNTAAYIESTVGIIQGGKSGLSAFVVAVGFLLSLFISPLFLLIPSIAVAPVLIVVGLFIVQHVKDIVLFDATEYLPAILIMILIPLTFNIADGIFIGVIVYVLIKLFSFKFKELGYVTCILAFLFLLKYILI